MAFPQQQIEGGIPDNLNLNLLETLYLNGNHIRQIDPQRILEQFPQLTYLNLDKNPLTRENVIALRNAAAEIFGATGRLIQIIANDIGEQYLPEGYNIKGAD